MLENGGLWNRLRRFGEMYAVNTYRHRVRYHRLSGHCDRTQNIGECLEQIRPVPRTLILSTQYMEPHRREALPGTSECAHHRIIRPPAEIADSLLT